MLTTLVWLIFASTAHAEVPQVVTTIRPLHSLTANLMEGIGEPELLIETSQGDPHHFTLRPSSARRLARADIILWIGRELEGPLARFLGTLSESRIVSAIDIPGMRILDQRRRGITQAEAEHEDEHGHHAEHEDEHGHHAEHEAEHGHHAEHEDEHGHHAEHEAEHGHHAEHEAEHGHHAEHEAEHGHHAEHEAEHGHHGMHEAEHGHEHEDEHGHDGMSEAHEHGDEHGHHESYRRDPHIWLDLDNAVKIVDVMTTHLIDLDPDNADAYRRNRESLLQDLTTLDETTRQKLRPVQERPYIIFHDSIQYFERRYGLRFMGALTTAHGEPVSAKVLRESQRTLGGSGCVVYQYPEPPSAFLEIMGQDVSVGVVDLLGLTLEPGRSLYFEMIDQVAEEMGRCLGGM